MAFILMRSISQFRWCFQGSLLFCIVNRQRIVHTHYVSMCVAVLSPLAFSFASISTTLFSICHSRYTFTMAVMSCCIILVIVAVVVVNVGHVFGVERVGGYLVTSLC